MDYTGQHRVEGNKRPASSKIHESQFELTFHVTNTCVAAGEAGMQKGGRGEHSTTPQSRDKPARHDRKRWTGLLSGTDKLPGQAGGVRTHYWGRRRSRMIWFGSGSGSD